MLTVTRPTPTTVQYVVSTRSSTGAWHSKASTFLLTLIRIAAGLFAIALAWVEYKFQIGDESNATDLFGIGLAAAILNQVVSIFHSQHVAIRIALVATILYLSTQKFYQEESLLVIRGLGVQTTTASSSYLIRNSSTMRFIPTTSIQDIFIHEAFRGFEVRFYLAIVVEGEPELRVVFPNILPRREVLETVWRGTRACLYEPTKS